MVPPKEDISMEPVEISGREVNRNPINSLVTDVSKYVKKRRFQPVVPILPSHSIVLYNQHFAWSFHQGSGIDRKYVVGNMPLQ
ncbi:hypothetical protein pipiens_009786, partial [Culex pipiens pipiens]